VREGASIIVRLLKYDGTEYRRWNARITLCHESLIALDAEFEFDVQHHLLGDIRRGTRTLEYYWLDRWYNVFRFLEDDGETRLYYCNVGTPPALENDTLSYIDLDVDILVQPDLSYQVLDLEEFETNAERYGYSDEVELRARKAVEELISLIETRQFPFDEDVSRSSVSSVVNSR
jgi:protein associated with RNAse G/E